MKVLKRRSAAKFAVRMRLGAILLTALLVSVCVGPVAAQDGSKYEFSGSYAYMREDSGQGALSLHGVSFSLARNVNRWLAIVGDGGGYHSEGFRLATVQAGARFAASTGRRVSVFSQALLGLAHANAGARGFPTYQESVAWTVGGALDCRFNSRISLRLAQAEYVETHLGGQAQHNFRAGAGIVFHFGGQR